jgi:hypothetical protein
MHIHKRYIFYATFILAIVTLNSLWFWYAPVTADKQLAITQLADSQHIPILDKDHHCHIPVLQWHAGDTFTYQTSFTHKRTQLMRYADSQDVTHKSMQLVGKLHVHIIGINSEQQLVEIGLQFSAVKLYINDQLDIHKAKLYQHFFVGVIAEDGEILSFQLPQSMMQNQLDKQFLANFIYSLQLMLPDAAQVADSNFLWGTQTKDPLGLYRAEYEIDEDTCQLVKNKQQYLAPAADSVHHSIPVIEYAATHIDLDQTGSWFKKLEGTEIVTIEKIKQHLTVSNSNYIEMEKIASPIDRTLAVWQFNSLAQALKYVVAH